MRKINGRPLKAATRAMFKRHEIGKRKRKSGKRL